MGRLGIHHCLSDGVLLEMQLDMSNPLSFLFLSIEFQNVFYDTTEHSSTY